MSLADVLEQKTSGVFGRTGTLVGTSDTQTLSNKTIPAPAISDAAITGSSTGVIVSKTITFTEDATSVTHTGTVVIPAGATLHDIIVTSSVLWTDSSAAISVGDAEAATGWFNAVNLAATDLLVGEALRASSPTAGWAGKPGAYLVAATGVFGQATSTKAGPYYVSAGSVIGVVSVTSPSGTAGRTFMTVVYSVGNVTAATVA